MTGREPAGSADVGVTRPGTIENSIINSPYVEPAQHLVTTADGKVAGEIAPGRRPSEFFVP